MVIMKIQKEETFVQVQEGAETRCDLLLTDSGRDGGRGGDSEDGAVLSAPPPHHSWVATVFGLFVTDLYLDSAEKKHRAIPQTVKRRILGVEWTKNEARTYPEPFTHRRAALLLLPPEAKIN